MSSLSLRGPVIGYSEASVVEQEVELRIGRYRSRRDFDAFPPTVLVGDSNMNECPSLRTPFFDAKIASASATAE